MRESRADASRRGYLQRALKTSEDGLLLLVIYLIMKLFFFSPYFSPFCTKSFGCPRSRRGKPRCSRAKNCSLPNAPPANRSESSGPVATVWAHHVTKFGSVTQVCHPAEVSHR